MLDEKFFQHRFTRRDFGKITGMSLSFFLPSILDCGGVKNENKDRTKNVTTITASPYGEEVARYLRKGYLNDKGLIACPTIELESTNDPSYTIQLKAEQIKELTPKVRNPLWELIVKEGLYGPTISSTVLKSEYNLELVDHTSIQFTKKKLPLAIANDYRCVVIDLYRGDSCCVSLYDLGIFMEDLKKTTVYFEGDDRYLPNFWNETLEIFKSKSPVQITIEKKRITEQHKYGT